MKQIFGILIGIEVLLIILSILTFGVNDWLCGLFLIIAFFNFMLIGYLASGALIHSGSKDIWKDFK